MGEQCSAHAGLERWLERIEKKLDSIAESIHGNGSPGLRDRVLLLEETNRHSEAMRNRNENRLLTAFKVLGPWIISVLAILIGVLYDKQ